jgi:ubiquitin carboxyl-terminal hydrolase 25/28
LTSPPPQHDNSKPGVPAVPARNCRHALLNKTEQSQLPVPGDDPDHTTVYKVASYCSLCRWHIDVIVDFRNDGSRNKPCKKGDEEYMLHHFLFEGDGTESHSTNGLGSDKAPRSYTFRCSAPPCPAVVHIRMRPPHLSDTDIETLTNQAQLRKRWEYAKQVAGDRADPDMARRVDGPDYLNTYLTDALNPVKGKSRIPLLNRKFLKTFGRDCDSILLHLGWTTQQEEEGQAWYLPQLEGSDHPSETALRQTIEDTRYELHAIILKIPENERVNSRHSPIYPLPSRDHIERALACHDCK